MSRPAEAQGSPGASAHGDTQVVSWHPTREAGATRGADESHGPYKCAGGLCICTNL